MKTFSEFIKKTTESSDAQIPKLSWKTTLDAASLIKTLNDRGIKEPLWADFQKTTKFGPHIRRTNLGSDVFELRIEAMGHGYRWAFYRMTP